MTGISALELLRRPAVGYAALIGVIGPGEKVSAHVAGQIETEVKYEGYIRRQQQKIEALARQEKVKIPPELDYGPIEGIRLEAREKLSRVRPKNLGQAAGSPGSIPRISQCSQWSWPPAAPGRKGEKLMINWSVLLPTPPAAGCR